MTLDAAPFRLSDLKGRPVIVNFWASWCVPCRNEFPLFKTELAKHQAAGLVIVGVLFKDDKAPALQFEQQFGATWSSVLDPDGSFARAYRVVAPPQTYFIDTTGVIRSRQIGEVLETDFDRQVAAILP